MSSRTNMNQELRKYKSKEINLYLEKKYKNN